MNSNGTTYTTKIEEGGMESSAKTRALGPTEEPAAGVAAGSLPSVQEEGRFGAMGSHLRHRNNAMKLQR